MPYLNNLNYHKYILKIFFFNLNRTYLNNNSSKVKAFLLEPCYSARKNKKIEMESSHLISETLLSKMASFISK